MMMQKVRTNDQCAVNEDLFFPIVKYVQVLSNVDIILTPFQKFLKTELIVTEECVRYKCHTKGCRIKNIFHPIFIEKGLGGCRVCDKIHVIINRILEAKGYKLIKFYNKENGECYIEYSCSQLHMCGMYYKELRRGKSCTECIKELKVKKNKDKLDIPECGCTNYSKYKRRNICQHYNYATTCPDAVLYWDYVLNDALPNELAPSHNGKYWFQCEKCSEFYKQCPDHKRNNTSCPCCMNRKISTKNNLLITHPEISKEWDFDNNFVYPNEVTAGSHKEVGWICKTTNEKHSYIRMIAERTGKNRSGCYCKDKNYKQRTGKHDYFVSVASVIHNNKYSYPEKYINSDTKINIYCPVIGKHSDEPHGNFLQSPHSHKAGYSCPKCANEKHASKGVVRIKNILTSLGYNEDEDYICEQTFPDMKYRGLLRIDFFLKISDISIAIEFDGKQHFSAEFWGGEKGLEERQKKDFIKDRYCLSHGICMLRFPYNCTISEEYIKQIIELCKKSQVYMSYTHLVNPIKQKLDLNKVLLLENKNFER